MTIFPPQRILSKTKGEFYPFTGMLELHGQQTHCWIFKEGSQELLKGALCIRFLQGGAGIWVNITLSLGKSPSL